MIKTLLGTKQKMESAYDHFGRQVPVTIVAADSNVVLAAKDNRVLLGYGQKKKAKKTEGAFTKAVGYSPRFIKEVTVETPQQDKTQDSSQEQTKNKITIGDKIPVSIFEVGDLVKVSGTTKGKGFAGGVKRHGFAGGPKTHGQSDRHRAPGSIGAGTTPGRVFKGKRMAGHMGNAKLTIVNLEVIQTDPEKGLLYIKGSIPGADGGFLTIEKTGKAKVKVSQVAQVSEEKAGDKEPKEKEETKGTNEPFDKSQDKPREPEIKAKDNGQTSNSSITSDTKEEKKEGENADK